MTQAILNVKARQYIVKEGMFIECDRLHNEEGESVEFPIIGFLGDYTKKGKAVGTILKHYLGKKKVAFYKTRRNGDRHTRGSRPRLTRFRIDAIVEEK
jgi:ribosomal protein L21